MFNPQPQLPHTLNVVRTALHYPIRGEKFSYCLEADLVYSHRSEFQQIDIYDTECFGRMLLLDGHIQLSALDEAAYHEALVHIPLLSIQNPKRALVIGGGDGGVLRELCKWSSIEHVDMIEIDAQVIAACREHLPELNAGAFDDPRVSIHLEDAFHFIRRAGGNYDLIVADITDVYENEEGALSETLQTQGFDRDLHSLLNPKGFVVSQADNHVFCPYSLKNINKNFEAVFARTGAYRAIVPSFGGFSAYCWASKGAEISREWPGVKGFTYLNAATYAFAMDMNR